jgi:hypothetical protein
MVEDQKKGCHPWRHSVGQGKLKQEEQREQEKQEM